MVSVEISFRFKIRIGVWDWVRDWIRVRVWARSIVRFCSQKYYTYIYKQLEFFKPCLLAYWRSRAWCNTLLLFAAVDRTWHNTFLVFWLVHTILSTFKMGKIIPFTGWAIWLLFLVPNMDVQNNFGTHTHGIYSALDLESNLWNSTLANDRTMHKKHNTSLTVNP